LNVLATDFAPGEVSSPRCSLDDDFLKLDDYLCPSSLHVVSGHILMIARAATLQ
jgi:hypothetical protein